MRRRTGEKPRCQNSSEMSTDGQSPRPARSSPAWAAEGEGIKCCVHSEYAPLSACLVGNPSASWMANGETWEYADMFAGLGDEFDEWVSTYGGTELSKTDPETWEKMAMESDALAAAYRKEGVTVIRNETGHTPDYLIDHNLNWSKEKQYTLRRGRRTDGGVQRGLGSVLELPGVLRLRDGGRHRAGLDLCVRMGLRPRDGRGEQADIPCRRRISEQESRQIEQIVEVEKLDRLLSGQVGRARRRTRR